jgi:3D-(3,5/4)-trihydroxycyclohexane-1,2-dione acylhydrolase (decyclizing)
MSAATESKDVLRLTMAQALVKWMTRQYVERDGREQRFFAGMWGIFGHGNVAGVGQALDQYRDELPYVLSRNEQAQVHAAAAFARQSNRLQTWACTTSVGPGATNMVTGAAGATINRLPVLLLPGDTFASRRVSPVLQQLESPWSHETTVNDAFKPVSRYWDRISRPEQLLVAAPEAMRVLTDQADTGAVTLALPQDVQAEAYDYPAHFFRKRVYRIRRPAPDAELLREIIALVRAAKRPLIIAGGGVIYAEATNALHDLTAATGIPVAETMAGKGAMRFDDPCALGAMGATGTPGANIIARDADLVIGIGTRWSDFTTASHTAFQNPDVQFININIARFDAQKLGGLAVIADARATIEMLTCSLTGWEIDAGYRARVARFNREWNAQVEAIYHRDHEPLPSQGEVIGAVNDAVAERDVVVCAAGSLPGDLHKLWRCRDAKNFHVEYGYSCMGYEVAGGLGVKMAAPDREVYVMVGDGSWLMMSSELVTSLQEGIKLIIVLIDNHGFASIGALSESLGSAGFGTEYRYRSADHMHRGAVLPVDLAANAQSLGACVHRTRTVAELKHALDAAKSADRSVVIVIETDRNARVGGFESWWDVPVAEVSEQDSVRRAREQYDAHRTAERWLL